MLEANLLPVFLVGLLGGVHCVGMCGGIVTAFSMRLPGQAPKWPYHLAYSTGRIASYAVAGAIAGGFGASGLLLNGVLPVQQILYFFTNIMLLAMGLYLAGLWHGIAKLEQAGSVIWQRVQPISRRLLPVNSAPKALALGGLWGWLPCGLVYSVLFAALMSASAGKGALIMLAFGLGTLPNLIGMGLAAGHLQAAMGKRWVRLSAGLAVAAFGVWGLFRLGGSHVPWLADFCTVP
ncbi:MAG: sulfite exporter TauE/SafE family protein [Betaproteobacteria bacterium]|nr:sulfite exporter TauE/SafE family protein [Betaproteobacteria bacterium]